MVILNLRFIRLDITLDSPIVRFLQTGAILFKLITECTLNMLVVLRLNPDFLDIFQLKMLIKVIMEH